MRRRALFVLCGFALAALGALLSAVPSTAKTAAALPSGNLIQNPGAEDGPGAADAAGKILPPHWAPCGCKAGWTAVQYGASGGFPGTDVGSGIGGGRNFFAAGHFNFGGAEDGLDYLVQQPAPIDVSAWAAEIDSGNVQAGLSALLGGYASDPETAAVEFDFLSASSDRLGSLTLGPVNESDRNNETKFVSRSATTDVPAGTRGIDVLLKTDFYKDGTGSYIDAYFDNISLVLSAKTQPPTTVTTTAPVPPTSSAAATTSTTAALPPPATTSPKPPTTTSATTSSPRRPSFPSLSLVCAGHTLVATVKPVTGAKILSVGFYVNGKLKLKDVKAPFVAAVPTKGLRAPLAVSAVIRLQVGTLTLRKQFHLC